MASSCDAAIEAHRARPAPEGHLPELVDGVRVAPTRGRPYEGQERKIPPPLSSYGFQKLAVEYFARAAWDQYELPYTIVGRSTASASARAGPSARSRCVSGNVKLAMSHVVPDLVQKVLKGQDPLHILGDGSQVRHYTYGGDLARASSTAHGAPDGAATRTSTSRPRESTTVLELAEVIWRKIKGPDAPFRCVSDDAVRARRAAKRVPADREGQRGARLRGHHLARRDARRGRPLGGRRGPPRPDLTRCAIHCCSGDNSRHESSNERRAPVGALVRAASCW